MLRYVPRIKRVLSETFDAAATREPIRSLVAARSINLPELRAAADASGKKWEYGTVGAVEFDPPVHHGRLPPEFEAKIGRFEIEQPFVTELEDIDLVGPHPIAVSADGRFVLEQSLRSPALLLRGVLASFAAGRNPLAKPTDGASTEIDAAIPLVGVWNRGFFHWFSEWLPRLEGLRRYEEATGRTPTLLVPADPPAWLTSSLEFLDYDDREWMEWPGGRVRISRLVLPSLRRAHGTTTGTSGYIVPPDAYRWVRNELLDAVVESTPEPTHRILITRAKAEERRVTNVAEITATIPGIEAHTLDDLDLAQQIRLFAEAELVIGPHGAGLTNLIYARNPMVVEAFGDFVNPCYFTLSAGLEYPYAFVEGTSQGADIAIDPDAVQSALAGSGWDR